MRTVIFTRRVERDFSEIARYITRESGSLRVARQFIAKLRAKCRHLASLPGHMGVQRPELGADIRSTSYGNYVIFFRYREDAMEMVAIIEGHRDILAQFDPNAPDTRR